jgi:hypothetical protein
LACFGEKPPSWAQAPARFGPVRTKSK